MLARNAHPKCLLCSAAGCSRLAILGLRLCACAWFTGGATRPYCADGPGRLKEMLEAQLRTNRLGYNEGAREPVDGHPRLLRAIRP